jgi:cytoskeletal protein CcmA (bactofilin family)
MEKDPTVSRAGAEHAAQENKTENAFVKAQFDAWLNTLKPNGQADEHSRVSAVDDHSVDFFVQCNEGTNCQIWFEGVLRVDGAFAGNIRSATGTLLTGRGCMDTDVEVRAAFLDSFISGDIKAAERVVLHSHARVIGNIRSRALSIKRGAIFEGDFDFEESSLAGERRDIAGANHYRDEVLAAGTAGD